MTPRRLGLLCLAVFCLAAPAAWGQVEPFKKKVGEYKIQDVAKLPETGAFEMPFILWGGDVATFHANGGLLTKDGTIFNKLGLELKLVPGDNFVKQVKDYVEGRSAFLRGTLGMIGLASEVVGDDPRTKPVIFLQMTWSRGDHMVARDTLKTLNELKGKKVCLQKDGPHVSMLDDILKTADLKWSDITPVWVDEISGPNGPAEKFRKDETIDACFVISPDMQGLTGGLRNKGTGGEGTVKGAQVLVSTAELSRSIADVYACRKDFYDKHKDLIEKFAAGYLKAVEEVQAMKPGKDKAGKPVGDPAKYKALCELAVAVYGKNVATKGAVANAADADGLISDCDFTGLKDNFIFFNKDKPDPVLSFQAKMKSALDLATNEGYAAKRVEFLPPDFDYAKLKKMADLKEDPVVVVVNKFGENPNITGELKPIFSFTISFDPDDPKFPVEKYGADFERAVQRGKLYADAVIEIRGHADGHNLVRAIIGAAVDKGILTDAGNGMYALKDGSKMALTDVRKLLDLVAKENFSDKDKKEFKEAADKLQALSNERAEEVRKSILAYAKDKGYTIDQSQMKFGGVGVLEPAALVLPPNNDARAKNRRVEFRISAVVSE